MKREPSSQRHPSDALVERLRLSVERAAGMSVDGMVFGLAASAKECAMALEANGKPEDIVGYALTAATLALALFQSLDDYKIHKYGTPIEFDPITGKEKPS